MNILYYGCGLNIHKQILFTDKNEFPLLCCPVHLPDIVYSSNSSTLHRPVEISLPNIFWKNGNEWELSGHKCKYLEDIFSSIKSSPLVRSSEKRVVFLRENEDIMVCSSTFVRKLYLQYTEEQNEGNKDSFRNDTTVKDIAVEDNCLLCIDGNGRLFSSGVEIPLSGMKICRVSVGKEHCLALTERGEVLSWGSGMKGQLGNGEINKVEYPEVITSLEGLEIISICCGGWHSAALSASGDVYVWGWNDVGQLGFHSQSLRSEGVKWDDIFSSYSCHCPVSKTKNSTRESKKNDDNAPEKKKNCEKGGREDYERMINSSRCTECINVQTWPKLVDFWRVEFPVKKVACGDRHTLFLLENGTAWTTGWNMYGQLGLGSNTSKDEPQMVPLHSVEDIFAGGWNSVLAVSDGNG